MSDRDPWRHPTLADTGETRTVTCRCGRPRRPLEMLDVAGLDAAAGSRYLCTTCVEDLHRREALDRLGLHHAKGAPTAWLADFEAKLERGPLLRTGLPPRVWGAILARALDEAAEKSRALGRWPPM